LANQSISSSPPVSCQDKTIKMAEFDKRFAEAVRESCSLRQKMQRF
jgi:hypothetical protein